VKVHLIINYRTDKSLITITLKGLSPFSYGYLWWNLPFNVNGKTITAIAATGNGGQYILVFPKENIVAVFTGGAYNSQDDKFPFAMMTRVFLPTFAVNE